MSDVSYNRHLVTSPIKVSFWLIWICLLTWTISPSNGKVDVDCCSKDSVLLHANCSDGQPVRLHCELGRYILDPNEYPKDNFTVVYEEDNAWLVLTEFSHERISSDSFCIGDSDQDKSVALVCFEDIDDVPVWKAMLFCILSTISAIFLIITLAVYVLLPELRELQDKAMMAVVTSLAVSYIILSIQNLRLHEDEEEDTICVILGFLLYFGFISVFFWLNIVSFNIWRAVWFKNCMIKEKPLFIIYSLFGWGGPMCFLIGIVTSHHLEGNHLKPGFGKRSCWFSGAPQTWAYFYGPIAILLTLNVIYLGLTSWRLWHQYRECSGSKLRALRFKCLLYVKLILVMGITWIFEVVSFAEDSKNNFWLATDILNALQGLIIFLLLVATRKRVRKLLAKKKPCGIVFPKSWVAYEDEECEVVLPEELELSHQG